MDSSTYNMLDLNVRVCVQQLFFSTSSTFFARLFLQCIFWTKATFLCVLTDGLEFLNPSSESFSKEHGPKEIVNRTVGNTTQVIASAHPQDYSYVVKDAVEVQLRHIQLLHMYHIETVL
uniref:Uncharacterized protein n=1 Tax=Glossina brevipalpis TaxID=37001 RepID=A0A1A9WJ91_9MUSC